MSQKADIVVDITGLQCPVPLIETRKAIRKAETGQIIEFLGTPEEEISRKEILIAIENLKQRIVSDYDNEDTGTWHIFIKKEG